MSVYFHFSFGFFDVDRAVVHDLPAGGKRKIFALLISASVLNFEKTIGLFGFAFVQPIEIEFD